MSKKKTLLTILAVMLVCCIAVTGTLAFLTAQSGDSVVNTFTAAGGGKLIDDGGAFTLVESTAVQADNGSYSLDTTKQVTSNTYEVLPSTNLPKDPYISISKKSTAPAYLYVEVADNLAGTGLTWTIEDCWKDTGVTINKNKVYVYSDANGAVIVDETTDLAKIGIIKDDMVYVSDDVTISGSIQLSFSGYMAQATAGDDAAAAFTACFINKTAE